MLEKPGTELGVRSKDFTSDTKLILVSTSVLSLRIDRGWILQIDHAENTGTSSVHDKPRSGEPKCTISPEHTERVSGALCPTNKSPILCVLGVVNCQFQLHVYKGRHNSFHQFQVSRATWKIKASYHKRHFKDALLYRILRFVHLKN